MIAKLKTIVYVAIKSSYRALVPVRWNARVFGGSSGASRLALRVKGFLEHGVDHNALYDAVYFDRLSREMSRSGSVIAQDIAGRCGQVAVVDVGCGSGEVLMGLRSIRLEAWGLEYSDAAVRLCRSRGLTVHKFDLEGDEVLDPWVKSVDVVLSTEVAEHLPAECADRYVETCISLSRDWVIITAATPGQGGTDHVNEQPHSYWIDKFACRGLTYCDTDTEEIRAAWAAGGVESARARNVLVFRWKATGAVLAAG